MTVYFCLSARGILTSVKLKNLSLVEKTKYFDDEFDYTGSEALDGVKVVTIKPQVAPSVFPVSLSITCQYSSMNKWRNCTFDRSSAVFTQEHTDCASVKLESLFKGGHYLY